ncbi:MAG: DUF5693 family protein [Sporomusaceae bacterium]|nr:DUF5693 family protein [Sporomusaceae bacterium]
MANRYNKVFIALVLVGLMAALAVLGQRFQLEQNNRTVELVLDYEDAVELAHMEGISLPELLAAYKQAGITSMAVYETTLEKLNKSGKVTSFSGTSILHQYREGSLTDPFWRDLVASGRLQPEAAYVVGNQDQTFTEVKEDLIRRLSPERVTEIRGGDHPVLAVLADYEKVYKWNLGLPTDEMKAVNDAGFAVVARPTNYTKVDESDIDAVFARLDSAKNLSGIMFVGDEVTGYPGLLPQVADKMKARHLTLQMIEHPLQLQFLKQDGLLPLAAMNDYKSARVYVIPKDEQPKLKLDEAVHRWVLTDEERNIRVNLMRKYDKPAQGMTLLETNISYVTETAQALMDKGYQIGQAGLFPVYYPPVPLLALMILGVWAAVCLLVSAIRPVPVKYLYGLLLLPTVLMLLPLLKGGGTLVRQTAATLSAITLPVLAMTYQLDKWRAEGPKDLTLPAILGRGLFNLTIAFSIAMVGGLYVAALLGDVRFFLEMEIYRGVKATFVMPLLLIFVIYLTRFNLFDQEKVKQIGPQLKRLLSMTIDMKMMLALGVFAIAVWVYVGRSGHTAGVPVPAIELKLRAFLENAMYARPREKEFMIGHPAFLLAALAFYRRWPRALHFALVVVATIALGSLVETFAHVRTPVLMSFIRGIDGVVLGALFGIIAVFGVELLRWLSEWAGRRSTSNE